MKADVKSDVRLVLVRDRSASRVAVATVTRLACFLALDASLRLEVEHVTHA